MVIVAALGRRNCTQLRVEDGTTFFTGLQLEVGNFRGRWLCRWHFLLRHGLPLGIAALVAGLVSGWHWRLAGGLDALVCFKLGRPCRGLLKASLGRSVLCLKRVHLIELRGVVS